MSGTSIIAQIFRSLSIYEFFSFHPWDFYFVTSAGEYPIMRPGAEFSWISCCTFKSECGFMSGFFRMRNLRTGIFEKYQ